jgi:hypothetical protein
MHSGDSADVSHRSPGRTGRADSAGLGPDHLDRPGRRPGHAETLRVSFDLIGGPGNDAVGRSVLIVPAIL